MSDRPRMQDVAARAGVSVTTVSHAFSGRRPVSSTTKAAVLKAAFDLGFVGEGRAEGRSVGLLLRPPEALPGFAAGTESMSSLSGAVLLSLLASGFSVSAFRSLEEIGDQVGRLDAFVLLHPNRRDEVLGSLVRRGIPTVSYDPDPGAQDFTWWTGTDYAGSCAVLLAHLHDQGADRVALVIGSTPNMYTAAIWDVYTREMARRGRRMLVRQVAPTDGEAGGRAAMTSLLRLDDPPDAVVTSSGLFACGVIGVLREHGREVPRDVLVATMMDGIVAERNVIPVTAMRPDVHAAAKRLTELLVARMQRGDRPQSAQVELELVVRVSSARRPAP